MLPVFLLMYGYIQQRSDYLYVQDLWPENVITVTGISNPAVIKPIDKMVDYIYKNTDEIFATSPKKMIVPILMALLLDLKSLLSIASPIF